MKKTVFFLLSLCLLLSFVACTGGETSEGDTTDVPTTDAPATEGTDATETSDASGENPSEQSSGVITLPKDEF